MSERYEFEGFVLERLQHRVLRADGSELSLTPRHFAALLLFVENAGVLLDKDTLMRTLWPGLVVEDNNLSQTVSSLRRALGEASPGSHFIQTVARRGFRFVAPVKVLDPAEPVPSRPPTAAEAPDSRDGAAPATSSVQATQAPGPRDIGRRRWLHSAARGSAVTVGTVLALGAAGWAWRLWSKPVPAPEAASDPTTTRATLAVLPFKPLADESRDELLEIGMADSLITRLSIVPGLVVRSVGSVRRYAGLDQDPVRAARELDVDWIVDGSMQRRGEQLRVSARLLRASDGLAAWSDSFVEKFTGVFDIQDLISARVMQALATRLQANTGSFAGSSPAHAGGTRNTDAYQLYLAASLHTQPRRADGLRKASSCSSRRWRQTPVLRWPTSGWRRRIGKRCSAPTPRRLPSSGRCGRRCSARWRWRRSWPRPWPNRASVATTSTSTGRAPSVSSGMPWPATRTWRSRISDWRSCC